MIMPVKKDYYTIELKSGKLKASIAILVVLAICILVTFDSTDSLLLGEFINCFGSFKWNQSFCYCRAVNGSSYCRYKTL